MKNNNVVIMIIIAAIFAAGGFFAGLKYQQSKTPIPSGRLNGPNGQVFSRNGNGPQAATANRQGFTPVNGEIIASDEKSITVKLSDGSSKIVLLSDATNINKAETGSASDLTVGTQVAVFGTTNSDGSVTAQNVQINPVFRDFSNPNVSP